MGWTTAEYNSGVLVASGSIAQEAKDREIVARKLREHVQGADNNPLLIFPEGTCVNNHYIVTFKKTIIHNAFVAPHDLVRLLFVMCGTWNHKTETRRNSNRIRRE
ncbi:hypothetical protein IFM89_007557, partial [Coptis chinensis]